MAALAAVTERYRCSARSRVRAVERVVDRVSGTASAFCAFCAFGRAVSAASALWAQRRGHGEKAYGSIP